MAYRNAFDFHYAMETNFFLVIGYNWRINLYNYILIDIIHLLNIFDVYNYNHCKTSIFITDEAVLYLPFYFAHLNYLLSSFFKNASIYSQNVNFFNLIWWYFFVLIIKYVLFIHV